MSQAEETGFGRGFSRGWEVERSLGGGGGGWGLPCVGDASPLGSVLEVYGPSFLCSPSQVVHLNNWRSNFLSSLRETGVYDRNGSGALHPHVPHPHGGEPSQRAVDSGGGGEDEGCRDGLVEGLAGYLLPSRVEETSVEGRVGHDLRLDYVHRVGEVTCYSSGERGAENLVELCCF